APSEATPYEDDWQPERPMPASHEPPARFERRQPAPGPATQPPSAPYQTRREPDLPTRPARRLADILTVPAPQHTPAPQPTETAAPESSPSRTLSDPFRASDTRSNGIPN